MLNISSSLPSLPQILPTPIYSPSVTFSASILPRYRCRIVKRAMRKSKLISQHCSSLFQLLDFPNRLGNYLFTQRLLDAFTLARSHNCSSLTADVILTISASTHILKCIQFEFHNCGQWTHQIYFSYQIIVNNYFISPNQ